MAEPEYAIVQPGLDGHAWLGEYHDNGELAPIGKIQDILADNAENVFEKLRALPHSIWRSHRPIGAYLPVGQIDGDCSCGRGPWPCDTVRLELRNQNVTEPM